MNVKKRDGSIVSFDKSRIFNAVFKAYKEVYGDDVDLNDSFNDAINFTNSDIEKRIDNDCISVEDIQDIVEDNLMSLNHQVAKAYITYRYKHTLARNEYDELMREVKIKLNAEDVQNQNANVDEKSFGGRIGEMSDMVMKRYALDCCMSKMARTNHLENRIYEHDLSHYAIGDHNCLTIPFDDLLVNGFYTRQVDIRPAKSINTAFQLLAVIFQIQSLQQFGGVSASHLDWTMIPYVRYSFTKHIGDGLKYIEKLSDYKVERFYKWLKNDTENHPNGVICFDDKEFKSHHSDAWDYAYDMTVKELYQAVEGMYHNLNSLQSRSGNQLPFSSINYGTCTLPEGRLVTKALLDVLIKGVGKLHKTSVFPCGIFQCMRGVNRKPSDPNYDLYRLALKATSLRLYPNYANVDWSGNVGYDRNDPRTYFSTMGKCKCSSSKTF